MSLFSGRNDKRETTESTPATDAAGDSHATVRSTTSSTRASTDSNDLTTGRFGRSDRGRVPQGGTDVANIGKSVVFKGDLSGEEDLEIEGRVEGKIHLPSHQLTIGANGQAKAEIDAKTIIVTGHVIGNVTATERCEVQAAGVVDGDIRAPRLLVQEGAVVNGNITMGEKALPEAGAPGADAKSKSVDELARKTG